MQGFDRISTTSAKVLLLIVCAWSAHARTYQVDAVVLEVDGENGSFVAAHRPIDGVMPAMTMKFPVEDAAQLSSVTPGSRIEFEMKEGVARKIRKVAIADPDLIRPALSIGARVPDAELFDQFGRRVRLSDLRGKVIAIQFIYTRCPLAEVCPRMAASFATLQRRFESAIGRNLVLVSISLDPKYDTPAVLAEYAKLWRPKPGGWCFLTGSGQAVEGIASSFGVVYWPEDGSLTHTARTGVIDRDGRLAALVEGYSYRTDQLVELVRHQLEVSR